MIQIHQVLKGEVVVFRLAAGAGKGSKIKLRRQIWQGIDIDEYGSMGQKFTAHSSVSSSNALIEILFTANNSLMLCELVLPQLTI